MKKHDRWGIIRYAAGTGDTPEEDTCCFDGWYSVRSIAAEIARDWRKQYPGWNIIIVMEDQSWFSGVEWKAKEHENEIR